MKSIIILITEKNYCNYKENCKFLKLIDIYFRKMEKDIIGYRGAT